MGIRKIQHFIGLANHMSIWDLCPRHSFTGYLTRKFNFIITNFSIKNSALFQQYL